MTTPLLNKIDNIIDGYITHNGGAANRSGCLNKTSIY